MWVLFRSGIVEALEKEIVFWGKDNTNLIGRNVNSSFSWSIKGTLEFGLSARVENVAACVKWLC